MTTCAAVNIHGAVFLASIGKIYTRVPLFPLVSRCAGALPPKTPACHILQTEQPISAEKLRRVLFRHITADAAPAASERRLLSAGSSRRKLLRMHGPCGERDGFLVSPSKEKGRGCSYNRSIGPEETTVRNGEGLSGRRAIGHRRRGRSDTYGYPRLSAHRAARRPSPKKVIQGGAKAAA